MTQAGIYLDNAATTRCDPRVVDAMLPYFSERFGNPASRTHPFGWEAEEAVERAREQVAALIGAEAREIIFTSGATEANNLALKGALLTPGGAPVHLIMSGVEHSSILEPAARLEQRGVRITRVNPDPRGRIDPERIARAMAPDTVLVSVMYGNNETGILQDLEPIGRLCAERKVLLHRDATQAVGKVPVDVRRLGVHLLSCSAHKIYGPKGCGALFARRRGGRAPVLQPLQEGGGQERGLRPGTLNVPAIVGFGAACALAGEVMVEEGRRIRALRDHLEATVLSKVPGSSRNGEAESRLPGIASLHLDGLEGDSVMHAMPGVALSGGSACASASLEPSHVLLAMGFSAERARNSLRFSLGRFNTAAEVDSVIESLLAAVARLRDHPAAGA